jgi:agmatinase
MAKTPSKTKSKSPKRAQYRPVNPLKSPRFGDVATFNRLPYVPDFQGKDVDVVILGIPYDGGTTFRPGARFAPRAVRDSSVLNRNYNPVLGVQVFEKINVVDGGDISVNPLNMMTTFKNIETHVRAAHKAGARVVAVGGDHSVLLPNLRAVRAKYGPNVTLVHFDAHTDTADTAWGEKFHHGTPIRRAIEEGLLKGPRIFQIGVRGPLTSPNQDDYIKQEKINVLDIDAFYELKKKDAFFAQIRKTAGDGPVYLSFDVDGIDPVYAPGTGTPVVGGMTSFEALQSVRRLKGLDIIGADVVEISPPYDHAELTSLLGAALVFEFLSLMAL